MRITQESPKVSSLTNKASSLLTRPSRFRLPFKQKSNLTPNSSPCSSPPGFLRKFGKFSNQPRKSVSFSAGSSNSMDWKKKITNDHTDIAYRDAVSKLRNILTPGAKNQPAILGSPVKPKVSDITSPVSSKKFETTSPILTRRDRFTTNLRSLFSKNEALQQSHPKLNNYNSNDSYKSYGSQLPSDCEEDLFGYIDKQNEYINQLEKETKYCRDELGSMLGKVKDVIAENEALHDKQKRDILTTMVQQLDEKTDGYKIDYPSKIKSKAVNVSSGGGDKVLLEARLAELEAHLTQTRRNLRDAQDEIVHLRKSDESGYGDILRETCISNSNYENCDIHRKEIERLSKEKEDLLSTLTKFKTMVNDLRDKEHDSAKKVKKSIDSVERMQVEKAQSDMESKRLKEELERYQQRIHDMIQDNSRKIHEEKLNVEKKFRQEIDTLNLEMNQELDSLTKAKIDLERQRRTENDLKRELQQKSCTIEDLRQEMQIKLNHLQSELGTALMQKSNAEQELINAKLVAEKAERDGKQEVSRLQAEVSGTRKRLEQSEIDYIQNQDIMTRLNEKVSSLQRESAMAKLRLEGHKGTKEEESDLINVLQNMEEKHSQDMSEMEQLIQVQNNLLDKLRTECKVLTDKLEDTSRQYKKQRSSLECEKDKFSHLKNSAENKCKELEEKVQFYISSHEQMVNRLQKLEEDDKARTDRIFQLLTKQSGLLKENQKLQNEMALLKNKLGDYPINRSLE